MLTADDLDAAVASLRTALLPVTGGDWSVPAGTLDWDCWHTAEHVGDCLLSYAAQLVATPADRYVRFLANADEGASAAEVLEFAETGGKILAATVRVVPPGALAYHPTGMTGPSGFAGLGCVETLLHGQDIARGLGTELDPPRDLCARVLAARFPETPAELADGDPWLALQWATGRIDIPGNPGPPDW